MNNDIFFKVIERPIPLPWEYAGTKMWHTTQMSNWKMLIREDTYNPISVVTKDYKLVTNEEIINTCNEIFKDDKPEIIEMKNWADSRFRIKYRFPNLVEIPHAGKWSKVHPEINISNSYDASSGVHILGGAFILVCSNGMTVGVTAMQSNSQHKNSNKLLEDLPRLFEKSKFAMHKIFQDQIPYLVSMRLMPDDVAFLQDEFPKRYHKDLIKYVYNNDDLVTFWDLYQMGTYATTHILNRKHESTHKLEAKMFNMILKRAKWREKQ